MVNVKTINPIDNRPTDTDGKGESCGILIFPNKYNVSAPKMAIQMAKNNSLSNQCNCNTKSAFDKNLKARANSKKPKTTLTEFNHPPDFGNVFNHPGNIANNINGKANALENPSIPTIGAIPPFEAASTNKVPIIGPVQENETIAKAKAINSIPTIPPLSACLSTLLAHELGNIISKAPKKDKAKTTNRTKKITLNQTFVDKAFRESAPKNNVITEPKNT